VLEYLCSFRDLRTRCRARKLSRLGEHLIQLDVSSRHRGRRESGLEVGSAGTPIGVMDPMRRVRELLVRLPHDATRRGAATEAQ
jgi:hypothetical protein